MILCIGNVLTPAELEEIISQLKTAEFVDGKLTAGWHARLVKHNTQLKKGNTSETLTQRVSAALKRNPVFQMAVRPKAIRSPLFSRYDVGMSYGTHVDNAVMGEGELMRSDVSFTLFLNPPSEYDGGELVMETTQGDQAFKLDAGAMIVYPSTTLHRVEPVTRGVRWVVVSWVQSLVREASDREILFDLDTARHRLFEQQGKTAEFDLLSKSLANLLRKWAEV
ncbi:MAG: Fe2+-dependent dioxygenase [Leptolyngbyaceae cyanobacterium SL_7_1]|nr:Fe2+-dependent dioxygenase [Leptolyngbyaceae cyanobacterium SL_7_1]